MLQFLKYYLILFFFNYIICTFQFDLCIVFARAFLSDDLINKHCFINLLIIFLIVIKRHYMKIF